MKILVWGTGAVGGTIGAHMARAGYDVSFVDAAADHVAAMNQNGLRVGGPITEFTVEVPAYLPEAVSGSFDTVLLCVKSQHTPYAVNALAPFVSDDGAVVSVQNGINEPLIATCVGHSRTIGAFVNFGADYHGPGNLFFGGRGAVVLGELSGETTSRILLCQKAFFTFEENTVITDNIMGYLWAKLAYGAMLFATATTNLSIAGALDAPAYRDLFTGLAKEVLCVARANGITPVGFDGFSPAGFLPDASNTDALESLTALVAFNRKSAKTHSGIWRDLSVRKRKTELSILFPVVETGRRFGVPTPLTNRLIEMIREIEAGGREMRTENLDDLMRG